MPTPASSTTLNLHCRCGCSIGLRSCTNAIKEDVRGALLAAARVLGWRYGDGETACPSCAAGIEPRAVAIGPEPTRED